MPYRSASRSLLIATTSSDKLRELRQILSGLGLTLLSRAELGITVEVEESGSSFRENADLKAAAYWQMRGVPCLAEDSGFVVDALDGAPGVYSARWEGHDYEHKNRLIVSAVQGRSGISRRCKYVCAMTLVGPDGRAFRSHGELVGRVAPRPAGTGGFGYDPIFLIPRLRRTLAELDEAEKHTLSHRGRAARRLMPILARVFPG